MFQTREQSMAFLTTFFVMARELMPGTLAAIWIQPPKPSKRVATAFPAVRT